MQMAEAQLKRYEHAKDVVAGVRVNDLRETYERAKVAYHEAQEKLPFLPKEPIEYPVNVESVPLAAPIAGRITALHVSPRQLVVQGDPLWTVADWSRLWVRVPVFEDDLRRVVPSVPIEVFRLESGKPFWATTWPRSPARRAGPQDHRPSSTRSRIPERN